MSPVVKSPIKASHLTYQQIESLMKSPSLGSLNNTFLCGVMGDPLASPFIREFFEIQKEYHPNVKTVIHTNGSLGSESVWRWLGTYSREHSLEVVFSIDGLRDSNHKYRIGVSWEKVLLNLETFIEAGGNATWKFIVFPHNEHQIDQARKLANELGCNKFYTRKNYDSERVPGKKTLQQVQTSKSHLNSTHSMSTEDMKDWVQEAYGGRKAVACKAEKDQQLYVDSWGRVWPCCWIGNLGLERPSFRDREIFQQLFLREYDQDFNNLGKRNLEQIVGHPFFKNDLKASWQQNSSNQGQCNNPACLKHCGVFN